MRACHPFRNGKRAISKSMEAPPESSSQRNASFEVRQGLHASHISVFLRVLAHTHPLGLLAHWKRLNSWPLIEEGGEDMIGVGYAARSLHNRSYLTFRLVLYAPGIPRTASKRTL